MNFPPPHASPARSIAAAGLVIVVTCLAVAPTLVWQQFSSGPENLVTASALEIRRGDCGWMVPTLQGEPRIAKPPLATWATAASLRPATVHRLNSTDSGMRERAYRALAWQVRWPALAVACAWLVAIFELGRMLRDARTGLLATAAAASSFFFLRYARYTTTDIHLALWVTVANVFLAKAILRGRIWSGCLGAGAALGLAMMSKGPVSLLESVPALIFLCLWRWLRLGGQHGLKTRATEDVNLSNAEPRRAHVVLPATAGVLLLLLLGGSWFALVAAHRPDVWRRWLSEVTRIGATETPPGPWYAYLGMFAFVLPWTVFLVVGMIAVVRDWLAARRSGQPISPDVLALLLLVVPPLVMSCFKDRQERYILPMLAPAAVVIAIGIEEHLRTWRRWGRADTLVTGIHWVILAAIAVVFPIVGASELLIAADGRPWFRPDFAGPVAMFGAVLVVGGILLHRKWPGGLVLANVMIMLVAQAVAFRGYVNSDPGQSDMKDLADLVVSRYPACLAYNAHPRGKRPPTDLSVYLNRIVRWIDAPETIRPDPHRATVLFMLQDHGQPPPVPPPGWSLLGQAPRDKDHWYAFVLPAP